MKDIMFKVRTFPIRLAQYYFRFDRWHVYGSSQPKYVRVVSECVNQLGTNLKIVEVGCGLGNIISKVNSRSKIGFDSDENVIRAALFIQKFRPNRKKVDFRYGSFFDAKFLSVDVLITVNWIHNIPIETLYKELSYFTKRGTKVVVDGVENYKYFHSEQVLSIYFTVESVGVIGPERRHIFLLSGK